MEWVFFIFVFSFVSVLLFNLIFFTNTFFTLFWLLFLWSLMVWIIFNLISFPAPSLFSFGTFIRFFFALQTGLHQIAGRKRFCFADILIFLLSVTFFVVAASPVALFCLSLYCFAVCPICFFFISSLPGFRCTLMVLMPLSFVSLSFVTIVLIVCTAFFSLLLHFASWRWQWGSFARKAPAPALSYYLIPEIDLASSQVGLWAVLRRFAVVLYAACGRGPCWFAEPRLESLFCLFWLGFFYCCCCCWFIFTPATTLASCWLMYCTVRCCCCCW